MGVPRHRVNLSFESLEELLARWPDACAAVGGAAPRDFGGDLPY
jgi:hypothetical protein